MEKTIFMSGVKNSSGQLPIKNLEALVQQLQERVERLESVMLAHSPCQQHKKKNISSNLVLTTEQQWLFGRAVYAGLMSRLPDSRYHWLSSKALLAYFCGRIFCGDYPQKDKDGYVKWMCGKSRFPQNKVKQPHPRFGVRNNNERH